MIIVLKPNTKKEEIDAVIKKIKDKGLKPVPSKGVERTVINVLGNIRDDSVNGFKSMECVEEVIRIMKPYKLASKEHRSQKTVIKVGDVTIGDGTFTVIAGPCSAENEEQVMKSAELLKEMGIKIMRASAFKPRTSPYDFQGLGIEGLKLLKKVREKTGMLVETEV